LLPAPEALVREAHWVGPGIQLSVVKGKSYEAPGAESRYRVWKLLPHLRESLGTYCSTIEIMGGASWTAVAPIADGKAMITTPDIGFRGRESPFTQNRDRLILNLEFNSFLSTLNTFL
jgi:hypothetical protein